MLPVTALGTCGSLRPLATGFAGSLVPRLALSVLLAFSALSALSALSDLSDRTAPLCSHRTAVLGAPPALLLSASLPWATARAVSWRPPTLSVGAESTLPLDGRELHWRLLLLLWLLLLWLSLLWLLLLWPLLPARRRRRATQTRENQCHSARQQPSTRAVIVGPAAARAVVVRPLFVRPLAVLAERRLPTARKTQPTVAASTTAKSATAPAAGDAAPLSAVVSTKRAEAGEAAAGWPTSARRSPTSALGGSRSLICQKRRANATSVWPRISASASELRPSSSTDLGDAPKTRSLRTILMWPPELAYIRAVHPCADLASKVGRTSPAKSLSR